MKVQVQETGVRKWYGDDFISMQNEVLKVIENGLLIQGDGILSGIQRSFDSGTSLYTFTPGMVIIDEKIYAFEGIETASPTIYIVPAQTEIKRDYLAGGLKNIALDYTAIAQTTTPGSGSYIETAGDSKSRYFFLKTDATGKFGTDFETIVNAFVSTKYGLKVPTAWAAIPGALYATPNTTLGQPMYMKDALNYYHLKGLYNGTLPTPQLGEDFVDFLNLPIIADEDFTCLEILADNTVRTRTTLSGVNKIRIEHKNALNISIDLKTLPLFR